MKKLSKITGEIEDIEILNVTANPFKLHGCVIRDGITVFFHYTPERFAEEWGNVPEKPKVYWFIDAFGNIVQNEIIKHYGDEYTDMSNAYENQKAIGNYFETKDEAEKAVEKLKAWKRLKDKGFEFCGKGDCLDTIKFDYGVAGYNNQDFSLLFGGEK